MKLLTKIKEILHKNKVLIALIVLAFVFRTIIAVKWPMVFFFDQARDAIQAQEIISGDIKLLGPSASGTHDTVYHGVIYYYLLALAHAIFGTNPVWHSVFLGLLNSLAVIPIYMLGKSLHSRSVGIIGGLVYAISYDTARLGIWLSNPTIATTVFPFFFWCLYESFFARKNKFIPWLALCLGLINQAMIFSVLWWVIIVAAYYLRALREKTFNYLPINILLISAAAYLVSVSTILLTQIKLFAAGIFTLEAILTFPSSSLSQTETLLAITKLYSDKLFHSVWPAYPLIGGVIFALLAIRVLRRIEVGPRYFLLLLLSGPFWLSMIVFRSSYHALIGLEPFFPLILGLGVSQLKHKVSKAAGITFIGLTVLLNLVVPFTDPKRYPEPFMVQSGVFLHDEQEMVKQIYEYANGDNFSISTFTNPFGWNTTWAWLFNIYKPKDAPLPSFFGPNQAGIFGQDLLEQSKDPLSLHFTIIEPDVLIISSQVGIDFFHDQNAFAGSPSAELNIGEFRVEIRDSRN